MVGNFIEVEIVIARANAGQRFLRAEPATAATANVILAKECALGAGIALEQLAHRDAWFDCRGGNHAG
jgi:hypothetical protein